MPQEKNLSVTSLFCRPAIYEQSCEAYKHRGNTSGFYFIDVDRSGPVEPQRLYCDMAGRVAQEHMLVAQHGQGPSAPLPLSHSPPICCLNPEGRTWTVVQHNNSELTTVSGGTSRHSAHFEYTSSEEQLAAIIEHSEHCQQELSLLCRKSRPFNIPGRKPLGHF